MAEAPAQERTIPQPGVVTRASGPVRAMERLGLQRDIDLALHLPLRYGMKPS
jgi:hypothetical protein